MDYKFFGNESIRGFTAGLNLTCASSSYTMCFPTVSRSPPIALVKYIILILRNMGYKVIVRNQLLTIRPRSSTYGCYCIVDWMV